MTDNQATKFNSYVALWQPSFCPILKMGKVRLRECTWLGQDNINIMRQNEDTHLDLLNLASNSFHPFKMSLMWNMVLLSASKEL